jgi:uncharacterized membrane protein YhiD involved in acid resistance
MNTVTQQRSWIYNFAVAAPATIMLLGDVVTSQFVTEQRAVTVRTARIRLFDVIVGGISFLGADANQS